MEVQVVKGDLLDQDVDVIVNAWNRNVIPWWLLLPQGVSGAIKRRAGYAPFRELGRKGSIPLGGAVITTAGKLPHKAIIHVAGINLLWTATEKSIRCSVQSAMQLAEQRDFTSIAFPVIGAGSGRFKRDGALEIMKDEFNNLNYEIDTRIVVFERIATSRQTPSPLAPG
jgi:O-acetyl-ADP-ribose deacetylase (regulator of RNase III)